MLVVGAAAALAGGCANLATCLSPEARTADAAQEARHEQLARALRGAERREAALRREVGELRHKIESLKSIEHAIVEREERQRDAHR
jgi:hypothetical protein